jgi:hypothetical protein
VNPFEASPIKRVLSKLFAAQDAGRPMHPVEEWLFDLDLNRPEIRAITVTSPEGLGVRAQKLYEVFKQDTGSKLSETAFGGFVPKYTQNPNSPLGEKKKSDLGRVYLIR